MINQTSKGFTLLEMLVYISLSLISIVLLSMATSGIYTHIIKAITTTNDRVQLHIAMTCMKKDVEHCSKVVLVKEDELLLETPKGNIAWLLVGSNLVRRTGIYNAHMANWSKKNSQKLAYNIDTLNFYSAQRSIIAEITLASYVLKSFITPKIGAIV